MDIFKKRAERLARFMKESGVAMLVFEDCEERRDSAVRYFSGHPGDAILAVNDAGERILMPWDAILAAKMADCEKVLPYNNFDRQAAKAAKSAAAEFSLPQKAVVEMPSATPLSRFSEYRAAMPNFQIDCEKCPCADFVKKMRACKDETEIAVIRRAAAITDEIIGDIERRLRSGDMKTELDAALFIEKRCREMGCERTSFDTLAAGPSRSFGIHAFPGFSAADFGTAGLSILDFGVCLEGYASDVTLTVAKDLTAAQSEQLDLVLNAYKAALPHYRAGLCVDVAAKAADDVFAAKGRTMPHTLGHGFGLDIHEFPRVKQGLGVVFEPGMVITLEPGLYDDAIGGCRLENDVLILRDGNEVITHSKIISM